MRPSLSLVLAWVLSLAAACAAEDAWTATFAADEPAGQTLRGFGRVAARAEGWSRGAQRAWVHRFRCADVAHATTFAGKLLADLTLSPHVAAQALTTASGEVQAMLAPNAALAVSIRGDEVRVASAPDRDALVAFLDAQRDLAAGTLTAAAYPAFLDRFDRYGWGMYGLDGTRNTWDWMKEAAKLDGKPGFKDPADDVAWLAKMGNRFEAHLDPALPPTADGLIANADDDWSVKLSAELGLPISFRMYATSSDFHGWLLRRFGEYQNQPSPMLTPAMGAYAVELMLSWHAPDAHRYQAEKAYEMVKRYADRPNVLGWMHPYGEVQTGTWAFDHGDYGPYAQAAWREFLRQHGCSLDDATRMYGRDVAFVDWSQVPEPEFATFAGLDGQVADLGGAWWMRPEVAVDARIDDAWWKQKPEERYRGLAERWWDAKPDAKDWTLVTMPGGHGMPSRTSITCTTWFQRGFALTPEQRRAAKLWLYFFPISSEMIHSGATGRHHEIFVNGEKAGEIGTWGALDVTRLLADGDNRVALHVHGSLWQGRIFISAEPPTLFPALPGAKNRLWTLWRQWLVEAPATAMSTVLEGMREADPDRPIKIMAPAGLGTTQYTRICARYGAYPHFTGEGMWFYPWYKRASFLYDVPGSSETAGPANPNDPTCGDEYNAYRRVFMEGLNAHDPVFFAQEYSRIPALRAWFEQHQRVLRQMGRYDLDAQQVLIYRSDLSDQGILPTNPYPPIAGQERPVQRPWDWDIGRGTLQSLGQSYLYLDEQGVADGKMNPYRVMVDCGNEIIDAATVAHLADWVRGGGTFVALPFTGRSSLTERDSWPIRALTGCDIAADRAVGTGTVTILAEQSVFTANAGASFPDAGSSVDWVGNQLNRYGAELKPGPGDEVVATYEDGAAAIVRHRIGLGSVIVFGSTFWRHSHDSHGIWWPQSPEPEVIGDLLDTLGMPAPCTTDGQLVWPQPFRSNNGLDQVAVLTSWNEDKDVNTTLRLRLAAKPAALVSIGIDGENDIAFAWHDGVAEATIAMPAREVKVVRAVGTATPYDALAHWWRYQRRMWHELVKPSLDLQPYREGRFADPTLDLRLDARFTNADPGDDAWLRTGFDDHGWTPAPLSLFRFWGAADGKPLWVRKAFVLPDAWRRRGRTVRLVSASFPGPFDEAPAIWLNGAQLDKGSEFLDVDVTATVAAGTNVLAFRYPGKQPVQGMEGEVYLYFRDEPALTVPLHAGEQSVTIPREWQERYRVLLHIDGDRYAIGHADVNGHPLGRSRPFACAAEYNLAAYLLWGGENRIAIDGRQEAIAAARLEVYPLEP